MIQKKLCKYLNKYMKIAPGLHSTLAINSYEELAIIITIFNCLI